ncbi:MAG TPA: hypothetical protein VK694_06295 [Verrucomicrobiae bacterium]|nr:hypothetical protein [Verrucomicrobiae bacterium]
MSIITITCSDNFYPADITGVGGADAERAIRLAEALPALVVSRAEALLLEADTPEEAVQVDFQKFHRLAVNKPDLWFRVELTEEVPKYDDRIRVRNTLADMFMQWFTDHGLPLTWALDVFFGPSHGCIGAPDGTFLAHW